MSVKYYTYFDRIIFFGTFFVYNYTVKNNPNTVITDQPYALKTYYSKGPKQTVYYMPSLTLSAFSCQYVYFFRTVNEHLITYAKHS